VIVSDDRPNSCRWRTPNRRSVALIARLLTKGSIRLDVVEYDEYGKPVAVYDFKFGSADLTTDRIARI